MSKSRTPRKGSVATDAEAAELGVNPYPPGRFPQPGYTAAGHRAQDRVEGRQISFIIPEDIVQAIDREMAKTGLKNRPAYLRMLLRRILLPLS